MANQISNLQRVLNHLSPDRYVCDDCLSVKSGVTPRQTVNRLCRLNFHLIAKRDDRACEGQCGKLGKTLRFLQSPDLDPDEPSHIADTMNASAEPKVDEVLGNAESLVDLGTPHQDLTSARYLRRDYLHCNFNEIIQRALHLQPDDYLGRLSLDGLMDLKVITSNIHALITLRLTFALVDWLQDHLKLQPEQTCALNEAVEKAKPFESGFDVKSESPNFIAEVKGNIPVKGGSAFGAAQLRGLTDDVLQMFGQPPIGKTMQTMSKGSKINRSDLDKALKFLGVYDSPSVRSAGGKMDGEIPKNAPSTEPRSGRRREKLYAQYCLCRFS